jgi:hypothetical protein
MNNPSVTFGDWENKPAVFPCLNTEYLSLNISTRKYNSVVLDGIGGKSVWSNPKNYDYFDQNQNNTSTTQYSSLYTGNVKVYFNGGLSDVYSLLIHRTLGHGTTNNGDKLTIPNLSEFLKQFPNLYSLAINYYAYNIGEARTNISGDLATIPDSIESVRLINIEFTNAPSNFYLNLNNFSNSSKLKKLYHSGFYGIPYNNLRVIGDIAKLPSKINFFRIDKLYSTSSIYYTSGRVWEANFDTFYLTKALTPTENDNVLIDMASSINTAIGSKLIYLRGSRTLASDAAVAGLQALGFTITISA